MFLIFFMQTKFKLRECKKIARQNAKYGQWFGPFSNFVSLFYHDLESVENWWWLVLVLCISFGQYIGVTLMFEIRVGRARYRKVSK